MKTFNPFSGFKALDSYSPGGAYYFATETILRNNARKRRGHFVGCCYCGRSDVTLYKVGDKRICAKCREEHNEKDS